MPRIALIPGDGIGPEVVPQARRVLEAVAQLERLDLRFTEWDLGAERWLRGGAAVTEEELRELAEEHDAILVGALGDPRVPEAEHVREILHGIRSRLDLYVSFRPCVLLAPELCPLRRFKVPVRLEVFRENPDGARGALGDTRRRVERVLHAAFGFARAKGRPRVTLVEETHAARHNGGLWRRVFTEVGSEYAELEQETLHVDALVADLVRRPERHAVIVTSLGLGEIVGDLAAELAGGLGLAPRADLHPGHHAMFGPVRGPAAERAGTGRVSPFGAVRCAALLLDHLGHAAAAERVEEAVAAAIAEGKTTPDMGGSFSTEIVGGWLAVRVAGNAIDDNATRT